MPYKEPPSQCDEPCFAYIYRIYAPFTEQVIRHFFRISPDTFLLKPIGYSIAMVLIHRQYTFGNQFLFRQMLSILRRGHVDVYMLYTFFRAAIFLEPVGQVPCFLIPDDIFSKSCLI